MEAKTARAVLRLTENIFDSEPMPYNKSTDFDDTDGATQMSAVINGNSEQA
jgi:hypothetical protein